ncbi:MAG: rRNA maturation RNase YbeY [Patescibacteria group bacterium]
MAVSNVRGRITVSFTRIPSPHTRQITPLVRRIMKKEMPSSAWDISIAAVTRQRMSELNRLYLHRKGTTDALSFCLLRPTKRDVGIGEIILDVPYIRVRAQKISIPFLQELKRVIAHACLHLAGYDHGTVRERREMERKELNILRSYNLNSR